VDDFSWMTAGQRSRTFFSQKFIIFLFFVVIYFTPE